MTVSRSRPPTTTTHDCPPSPYLPAVGQGESEPRPTRPARPGVLEALGAGRCEISCLRNNHLAPRPTQAAEAGRGPVPPTIRFFLSPCRPRGKSGGLQQPRQIGLYFSVSNICTVPPHRAHRAPRTGQGHTQTHPSHARTRTHSQLFAHAPGRHRSISPPSSSSSLP